MFNYIAYPNYQPNRVLISNRSGTANFGEILNSPNNDDMVTYQTIAEDDDYTNSNNTRTMTVIPHLQGHNSFNKPRQYLAISIPQPINFSEPIITQAVIAKETRPTSIMQQLPVGLNQSNVVYQPHQTFQKFNRNNEPILHYISNFTTHSRIPAQIINYPADPAVPAAPTYYPMSNKNNIVFQRRSIKKVQFI
jgi:hypothetical protein